MRFIHILAASTLFLVVLLLPAGVSARAKTDLIFIGKADRITGEIKQLDRGILQVKTDNIGTVNVEWEDVDSLNSVYHFRVENQFGEKYFGAIFMTKAGVMQIIRGGSMKTTPAASVIAITPLEASFWERIDGSIGLGFSYTKSNSLAQLTSDIYVRYRTPLRQLELDASNISTSQEDKETVTRQDIALTFSRLFESRWSATAAAGAQTNDELGLDMRLSFAPGAALDVAQTNSNTLTATAGLSVNREWSSFSDGGYNLEAFAGLTHSVFRYDYPKTDVTTQATVYPSLNNRGRVRAEIDISASREIVRNLTLVLTFYDSYDSEPLAPDASNNDYGLVTSIGWTF